MTQGLAVSAADDTCEPGKSIRRYWGRSCPGWLLLDSFGAAKQAQLCCGGAGPAVAEARSDRNGKQFLQGDYIGVSKLEADFLFLVRCLELPPPIREHQFHPVRKWRFDFAWPGERLAVEIDGGTWVQGRHNRGSGFEKDCDKFNAAAVLGWRLLRFTGQHIADGRAADVLESLFPREESHA